MDLDIAGFEAFVANNYNVFRAGALAYYDTFAGLVPCKIVSVNRACNGSTVGPNDSLTVKLTATRGAYKRGEVLTVGGHNAPPREMVRNRKYSRVIRTNYEYQAD